METPTDFEVADDAPSARAAETEAMVRAAWLYFIGEMNQSEIADRLGLSRVKVNRLIAAARSEGVVDVRIVHPSIALIELENRMCHAYKLDSCRVVPAAGEGGESEIDKRFVAIAAAETLARGVAQKPDGVFALSWGTTMAAVAHAYRGARAPRARFVSVMGSLTRKAASNPYEVVHRIAERTGGEGYFIPAPYLADTMADREVLMAQRTVRTSLDLARSADLAMSGVTEATPNSFLVAQKLVTIEELEDCRANGAVGSFAGLFFDRDGRFVDCDVNRRRVGVSGETFRGLNTVGIAAGRSKIESVLAALRGGVFRHLVTDETVARGLLAEAG
ncbi:sugar-binding transcriptional regulator [Methylopila sp. 73B]|uniref:sugar-binding transcriptional regulator n=1 Tax=Methylopila sp. 73B TaxID=1120792 RepID=UPI0003708608|nr:sugar-binding transcriptional regulator [Methylopila sp. 73B]